MHWEFENETQFPSTRLDTKNETELIFVRVRGEICIFSFSDDDESLVQVFCELLSTKWIINNKTDFIVKIEPLVTLENS